jgi:hypothetical protein
MWGQSRLVWACRAQARYICPAREGDDGLPDVANEAVGGARASTAIEAQSTFGNTVSTVAASRSRADEDGYVVEKRPG